MCKTQQAKSTLAASSQCTCPHRSMHLNISRARASWSLWFRTLWGWKANLKLRMWKATFVAFKNCIRILAVIPPLRYKPLCLVLMDNVDWRGSLSIDWFMKGCHSGFNLPHGVLENQTRLWVGDCCSGWVVELLCILSPGCGYCTALSLQCHPFGLQTTFLSLFI